MYPVTANTAVTASEEHSTSSSISKSVYSRPENMHITEIILLGFALAMDCFAVSVTSGSIVKRIATRPMLTMILSFGLFQGGMTMAGW